MIGLSLAQHVTSLREQEEGYRQYIGGVAQLMWRTNADGEVTADMPAWQAFTGQNGEQVRGAGWLDAVHAEDRAALLGYLDPGGFGGGFLCPVSAGRRDHMQPWEPLAGRWPRHKIGAGNPHKYY